MFNNLSDRLTSTFRNLRTRGRLSEADVDATVREIRRALLDADVAVPVVRQFTAAVRERALGAEVSGALNPAQQVVKIVHDELVAILGGSTRQLTLAKRPPTVILLAGLQGAGKTTLAGKLAVHLRERHPGRLLVRPRVVDDPLQAEQVGQVVAALPRRQHLADAGQRVAAVLEPGDEVDPRQVAVVVEADPAPHPGRREQAALLEAAHVPDRGPGRARQVVDAEVSHARLFESAVGPLIVLTNAGAVIRGPLSHGPRIRGTLGAAQGRAVEAGQPSATTASAVYVRNVNVSWRYSRTLVASWDS